MHWTAIALTLFVATACGGTDEADTDKTRNADKSATTETRNDRVSAAACTAVGWMVVEADGGTECRPPEVESEADCVALGGESFHLHLDTDPATCFLPTPDAGAACTDGDECAGFCEAPEDAEQGTAAAGTCSARTRELCFRAVEDGIAQGELCY